MNKLKNLRAILVGLLCVGLLLIGIGVGVAFGEFSRFTYGGRAQLDGMVSRTFSGSLVLEEGETLHIPFVYASYGIYDAYQNIPIHGVQYQTDTSIPQGQVRVDVEYRSVYSAVQLSRYYLGNAEKNPDRTLTLYTCLQFGSPLALLMAYKDQALEDIRQHRLSDYDEILIDRVVFTVNPADQGRVVLTKP